MEIGMGPRTKSCKRIFHQKLFKLIIVSCVALLFIYRFKYLSDSVQEDVKVNQTFNQTYIWFTEEEHFKLVPDGYLVSDDYLVFNPQCKISNIDPWNPFINRYINFEKKVNCSNNSLWTYIEPKQYIGNVLKVNKALIHQYKKEKFKEVLCCYSIITRVTESHNYVTEDADRKYSITPCEDFKSEVILRNTTEFIFVKCREDAFFAFLGRTIYSNVHAATPILPHLMKKLSRSTIYRTSGGKTREEKKLSVMLVGIDSVSRLSFHRAMPNALKFIRKNKWVELKGYSKVRLNTFSNLVSVLNGQSYEKNLEMCSLIDTKTPNRICPLIWDDYKKKGYVTAYAEDTPGWSTFNYLKVGFVQQPTDYYLRPMMVAADEMLSPEIDSRGCLGLESSADHILNYAKNFSKTFKDYLYFGLFWTNGFTHNDINLHRVVDFPLTNFLISLENIGAYENTLIVLFSDHGMRFGEFRSTHIGYYEDHLPFIFIWMPDWYKKKYPIKYKNLLKNRNRLATPFDLHLTLQEILREDATLKLKACPKCISLFKEVPWNRNCEDAGIAKEYCMCSSLRLLNITGPLAVEIGEYFNQFVVNKTRNLLKKYSFNEKICANRTFSQLVKGYETVKDDGLNNDESEKKYIIVIRLNPGPAVFEARILVQKLENGKSKITITSSINRIDSYAKTSGCVNQLTLKQLCHCV